MIMQGAILMIERLNTSAVPAAQPRPTANEGVRVNSIKPEEKAVANHFEQRQPKLDDHKEKESVEEVVNGLNGFLKPAHTSIKFKLHEKLNEYYVTVVDDNTNEVIKEIPAKKMLDMYAAMAEHLGFLVDKKI
jgi:flagellar protein FlaG